MGCIRPLVEMMSPLVVYGLTRRIVFLSLPPGRHSKRRTHVDAASSFDGSVTVDAPANGGGAGY